MLNFAYGSNMPTERIQRSDPGAIFRGIAELKNHKLGFTYCSKRWKAGAADIVPSEGGVVWGVLWEVSDAGAHKLDKREGVEGRAYRRERVIVLQDDKEISCVAYTVVDKKSFIPPSEKYLGLLLQGASEHHLPADYIAELRSTPTAT